MTDTFLFLASQSPRRSELLTQVGISFDILSVDIDEAVKNNEMANDYVVRLANEKALAGWQSVKQESKAVLGSDTSVVLDGQILGKPENAAEAKKMLALLSGKTHQVMTAVTLATQNSNSSQAELSSVISVSDVM